MIYRRGRGIHAWIGIETNKTHEGRNKLLVQPSLLPYVIRIRPRYEYLVPHKIYTGEVTNFCMKCCRTQLLLR